MFKFVVLVVLLAEVFGAPNPGYLEHYPAAVSHVSRIDIHDSKPVVTAYADSPVHYAAAPVHYSPASVHYAAATSHYAAAPVHYAAAPVTSLGYAAGHGYGYGYPVAQSYSNRVDVHHAPVVTSTLGHGYGGYNLHNGLGYGLHHGYGVHGLHHAL